MRLLITGGAGYIGRHTAAAAIAQGHQVGIVDRAPCLDLDVSAYYQNDLQPLHQLEDILKSFKPDSVLHLAASIAVGESVEHPEDYCENNVIASLRLLKAMRRVGLQRIVFASSAAVYGHDLGQRWQREQNPLDPQNPYGETKRFIEKALEFYGAYGIRSVSLRYFNASGGSFRENHDPETHLIPRAIDAAFGGTPLTIHGTSDPPSPQTPDPTAVRDYVSVRDIARANLAALAYLESCASEAGPSVFNIGSGRATSVLQVVREVELAIGKTIPYIKAPWRQGDPRWLVAEIHRAERHLGWMPSADSHLTAIIADAIATRSLPLEGS